MEVEYNLPETNILNVQEGAPFLINNEVFIRTTKLQDDESVIATAVRTGELVALPPDTNVIERKAKLVLDFE